MLDRLDARLGDLHGTLRDGNDPHRAIAAVVREMTMLSASHKVPFRFDPLKLDDRGFLREIQKVSDPRLPLGITACLIVGFAMYFASCSSSGSAGPSHGGAILKTAPRVIQLLEHTLNGGR